MMIKKGSNFKIEGNIFYNKIQNSFLPLFSFAFMQLRLLYTILQFQKSILNETIFFIHPPRTTHCFVFIRIYSVQSFIFLQLIFFPTYSLFSLVLLYLYFIFLNVLKVHVFSKMYINIFCPFLLHILLKLFFGPIKDSFILDHTTFFFLLYSNNISMFLYSSYFFLIPTTSL